MTRIRDLYNGILSRLIWKGESRDPNRPREQSYPPGVKVTCRWCGHVFRVRGKVQAQSLEEGKFPRERIELCNLGCLKQWLWLYRFYRDRGHLEHGDFEKLVDGIPRLHGQKAAYASAAKPG